MSDGMPLSDWQRELLERIVGSASEQVTLNAPHRQGRTAFPPSWSEWAEIISATPKTATKIEVTALTLAAIRANRRAVPGLATLGVGTAWLGVPVFTVTDMDDGKARVTYSDDSVEVIP